MIRVTSRLFPSSKCPGNTYPVAEFLGQAQALWQVYQSKLAEARRRYAQERVREDGVEEYWLEGR